MTLLKRQPSARYQTIADNAMARLGDTNSIIDVVNILTGTTLVPTVKDCSTNPNYPAAVVDQMWYVSVAGKIGGGSGKAVDVGDIIICVTANAGGTQASVGSDFVIIPGVPDVGAQADLTPVVRTNNPAVAADSIYSNIDHLDAAIGATVVPVVRTNNPTMGANDVNENISALDAAIGATVVPVVRAYHPTIGAFYVNGNISALDAAIGVTPTSVNIIAVTNSVNVNLSAIDSAVYALQTAASGTVAATGSGQGDGPIGSLSVAVVSAANGTKAITLPAVSQYKSVMIYNITAAQNLIVFPATGEYINAAAQNASVKFDHATDVSYVLCTYASAAHWTMTAIHGTIS